MSGQRAGQSLEELPLWLRELLPDAYIRDTTESLRRFYLIKANSYFRHTGRRFTLQYRPEGPLERRHIRLGSIEQWVYDDHVRMERQLENTLHTPVEVLEWFFGTFAEKLIARWGGHMPNLLPYELRLKLPPDYQATDTNTLKVDFRNLANLWLAMHGILYSVHWRHSRASDRSEAEEPLHPHVFEHMVGDISCGRTGHFPVDIDVLFWFYGEQGDKIYTREVRFPS